MTRERRMMVRMTEELHKAVRVKAAELGRPASEIVRELLTRWVAGDIELLTREEEAKESD